MNDDEIPEIADDPLDDALDDTAFDEAGFDDASEPAAGAPSGWQLPEPTGVQAVDEALEPLLDLDNVPTAEHVPAYEHAHRRLQDALADLDGS